MNPCEGFLEVLSFHGGDELIQAFVNVYMTLKKELRTGQKKATFNKICGGIGSGAPKWVMHIVQIFCATSAITSSDGLVRIDISGSVDRFIAYVLNYATIHQLTSIVETRPELDSFRQSVASAIRDRGGATGNSSVDSRPSQGKSSRTAKASIEVEGSIDEYTDDFDDGYMVETIRSPPRPTGRPRPVSAMKRQMSQKGISEPISVPSVISQEGSSVFEDYGDDFEKDNGSSIFSDHRVGTKPPPTQGAKGGDSVENEYADDFNDFDSSVASIPQAPAHALPHKESSVAEYADDFDNSGSRTDSKTAPSPARSLERVPHPSGSIAEYSDDFDGPMAGGEGCVVLARGDTAEAFPTGPEGAAEGVRVQGSVSIADDYADDFDAPEAAAADQPSGTETAEGAGPTDHATSDYAGIAEEGMVPLNEPLTRDNSDATFLRDMHKPAIDGVLSRCDSEATFLKNINNFKEENKEAIDLLTADNVPSPDPASVVADPMTRANSEASFVNNFEVFANNYKESFEQTAAVNAEKNRNISVAVSADHDEDFGTYVDDGVTEATTPKSLGFGAMGLPRFNSERSTALQSVNSGLTEYVPDFTTATEDSAKKMKKTISFVETVEYKDDDLGMGSRQYELAEIADAADDPAEQGATGDSDLYLATYKDEKTSQEKRLLFAEPMVYADEDLMIGSSEFTPKTLKKVNEQSASDASQGRPGSAVKPMRSPSKAPVSAGNSEKLKQAASPATRTIDSNSPGSPAKRPVSALPPLNNKLSPSPAATKRPVSASARASPQRTMGAATSGGAKADPGGLYHSRSAASARVNGTSPQSSPLRRNGPAGRPSRTGTSPAPARPATAPRAATYTGNIKKPVQLERPPSIEELNDRFGVKVVRGAAKPLDTGLRRSRSPVKSGDPRSPEPPSCIDITKVRVRDADELFELLRCKLGEAERMIGDSDMVWRKRLEEALKTQQDYWMDGKRSHEFRPLNYKTLRPSASSPGRTSKSPCRRRGNLSSGTRKPSPQQSSYMNENGELFRRTNIPTAHYSSGVLLCKLSSKEIDAAETLQVSLSKPIGTLNNLHQRQALLIKEAFDTAEDMMKQCAIAKYRCDKNPTSVNQKRLEVLSVRSVRVVLGSIEKVNEVCQLLKNNYTKLHKEHSVTDTSHDGATVPKSPPKGARAQSAPARRPMSEIQNFESREVISKRNKKRAQSAFSRRGRGAGAFTAKKGRGGTASYKKYAITEKLVEHDDVDAQDDAGIYSDDGDFDLKGDGVEEERDRGKDRVRRKQKVKKKMSGPKHTCVGCLQRFMGEVKRIPTSNSLGRDTIESKREEYFISKMNALNSGDLRDHERKMLRMQYIKRKKMDQTIGVHNKIFCSWKCARAWNNKNCAVQFKYYNNMLIDMAESSTAP